MPRSAASRPNLGPHVGADLGIQPGGRLVEEQHRRVVDERHRDVEAALHPAAVSPGDAVGGVGEPEPLEQLLGALLDRLPAHPVDLTLEAQVLAAGRLDVDRRALRDDADRPAHRVRIRDDVEAADERLACVGLGQRREDLDRG